MVAHRHYLLRFFALISAIALALVSTACTGDKPSEPTSTGNTLQPSADSEVIGLAKTLAPLVYLAVDEQYGPMDVSRYIDGTSLHWAHSAPCMDHTIDPDPTERVLAKGGYKHQKTNVLCDHTGPYYETDQPTRPHDTDELGGEGYFLDADPSLHSAGSNAAPVYLELFTDKDKPGMKGYVFWLFYPWNEAVVKGGNHEADWQRVSVVTDNENWPIRVVMSQHVEKCFVDWSEIAKIDGHPIVYSAKGTHGSYLSADSYDIKDIPIDDQTSQGKEWQTWSVVKEVDKQAWWGYAGGWGEVGDTIPILVPPGTTTGPAGPRPGRNLSGELFTDKRCPQPRSKGLPMSKEGAIDRFEQFLHALGQEDLRTVCEIAAPAAKKAEEQGFGPCDQTYGRVFTMISTEQKEALRNATVDPQLVTNVDPGRVRVPVEAVKAATTFTEDDLGSYILEYQDDNWYIIS